MFDEKDLIIDARHITRRFPAAGGKELTACNDINLQLYRGKTLWGLWENRDAERVHSCDFWYLSTNRLREKSYLTEKI